MKIRHHSVMGLVLAASLAVTAAADEGMWTFDNPPVKQLKDKYNFHAGRAMAGSHPAFERSLQRWRIGFIRKPEWSRDNESPRRFGPASEDIECAERLR